MYHVTRFPNGLTVATAEMPHMASVSVGIWVGMGSRYEPAELNGVCHFIEHLLFKGTRKRTAREISQAVEGIGGYLNAFTSEESTCYHARGRHDRFEDLLDVLADMFLNSTFLPEEIEKEREVIKEEIAMYADQPQQLVQELLNATLWPDQPLGRPITGTGATLDRIRRAELVGHLRRNYVTGNTVIAAAGRINHARAVRAVKRHARHFSGGGWPVFARARSEQHAPRVRLFTKATEQTQLALGFRACSRHDERRYALRVLNAIAGENMSSRLFQVLREDLGLAYSIYTTPSFFEDIGDFVVSAGVDTEKVPKALTIILRELRRLADKPPGPAELRRAREYLIGQADLGLENTESQMNWIGEQWLGYGRILNPDVIKRRLNKVTAAEVRAAARDVFRRDNVTLALVSPLKSDRRINECLEGW